MSSFSLRLLALFCMVIDHAGLTLFPSVGLFRCIGRSAFPLYCFLLTQGYRHTHDLRAYARRLLLLACLSEIPFDWLIFGRLSCNVEQNVLFSLLFGLMALAAVDSLRTRPIAAAAAALTLCLGAMLTRVSYGWVSIALCLFFLHAGDRRLLRAVGMSAIMLLYSLALLFSGVTRSWALTSLCALFSALPLLLYNGRRGFRHPALTALFYASYPLHFLLLAAIRAMRLIPPYFLQ